VLVTAGGATPPIVADEPRDEARRDALPPPSDSSEHDCTLLGVVVSSRGSALAALVNGSAAENNTDRSKLKDR